MDDRPPSNTPDVGIRAGDPSIWSVGGEYLIPWRACFGLLFLCGYIAAVLRLGDSGTPIVERYMLLWEHVAPLAIASGALALVAVEVVHLGEGAWIRYKGEGDDSG